MAKPAKAAALREKDAQALAALDLDAESSAFWDGLTEGVSEAVAWCGPRSRGDFVIDGRFDQAQADKEAQSWLQDATSSLCVGLAEQAEAIWTDALADAEVSDEVKVFVLRQVLSVGLGSEAEEDLFATVLGSHGQSDTSRECSLALHRALSQARDAIDEWRLTGHVSALGGSKSLPTALVRQLGVTP
jgi:hypothetical protein